MNPALLVTSSLMVSAIANPQTASAHSVTLSLSQECTLKVAFMSRTTPQPALAKACLQQLGLACAKGCTVSCPARA